MSVNHSMSKLIALSHQSLIWERWLSENHSISKLVAFAHQTLTWERWLTDPVWKLQCRLNLELPGAPDTESQPRFTARGGSFDALEKPWRGPAPELCVVIHSYARVEACCRLLEQLRASLREAALGQRVFVLVLVDPSPHDYTPVLALLERHFA